MPKAARVLAALKRDGWIETRRAGSHRVLVKEERQRVWSGDLASREDAERDCLNAISFALQGDRQAMTATTTR